MGYINFPFETKILDPYLYCYLSITDTHRVVDNTTNQCCETIKPVLSISKPMYIAFCKLFLQRKRVDKTTMLFVLRCVCFHQCERGKMHLYLL